MRISAPIVLLFVCLILVACAGFYVTFMEQPGELEKLRNEEKIIKMKRTTMEDLLSEYRSAKGDADDVMSKWRSRYKILPDSLSSPEVVAYMNALTQRGFETFDIKLEDLGNEKNYKYYTLRATGRGYFSSLYQFVWRMENSRRFYAIKDLKLDHVDLQTEDKETGRERLQVMVSFGMTIRAYFGGPEGISASDNSWRIASEDTLRWAWEGEGPPPVPPGVMPKPNPDQNPFFPNILDQIPPNTRGLLNIEKAEFVSIIGGQAVFKDKNGYQKLSRGDDVYLGQITNIDPIEGRVEAVLNRGGIIDKVALSLTETERYRRAMGPGEVTLRDRRRRRSAEESSPKDRPLPKDGALQKQDLPQGDNYN